MEVVKSEKASIQIQIREQMFVPDIYVLTVESIAYEKRLKREKRKKKYRTRTIISRGLYFFLPNFHFSCGLYYRQLMY